MIICVYGKFYTRLIEWSYAKVLDEQLNHNRGMCSGSCLISEPLPTQQTER